MECRLAFAASSTACFAACIQGTSGVGTGLSDIPACPSALLGLRAHSVGLATKLNYPLGLALRRHYVVPVT